MTFAQVYNLSQGIKKFGDKGKAAANLEMKQLHDRECWKPRHINELSEQERRKAMGSLIFLTEKRDGRIKARTVADGSKQRLWMNKDEASSPTVMLESLVMSAALDAKEGRDVAVIDIPNAFIQTENVKLEDHHETDFMKIKGRLVEMLVEIDPDRYGPYVTTEDNIPVLYVEILKAMYGMIKSPLLFYRKLRKDLENIGFKVNPYDICVANKIVNGKQITVLWHVDDLKVSHVDAVIVDDFIEWAKKKYEDPGITKLTPSRGKVHDYLGITLDYTEPGKVKLHMKDYIAKMIEEFPYMEEARKQKSVKTPAAEHLFKISANPDLLSPKLKDVFHTQVAKSLFLCKRTRPDLQPTTPFLCTRVKEPDQDDWKKLLRMFNYLDTTKDLELILEVEPGEVLHSQWFPDSAFAVHKDYKSHTGAIHTLGKGATTTLSAKQKLNTRSSTEAELVAVDDIVTHALWTRNFLEAQGYKVKTTIHQDNQSAILLEKNGKESSSKRTRHINIKYFFVTDCIEKELFNVKFCPTADMVGDFPSKPLQGSLFRKHRRSIMNSHDSN